MYFGCVKLQLDEKYIKTIEIPEVDTMNYNGGKKKFFDTKATTSLLMKNVLLDPNVRDQEITELKHIILERKKHAVFLGGC